VNADDLFAAGRQRERAKDEDAPNGKTPTMNHGSLLLETAGVVIDCQ
jgi:hypothetical protein